MNKEKLKRLPLSVRFLRLIHPNYSTCYTCGLPWSNCTPHTIKVDEHVGVFAQCEYCYQNSDSEAIIKANEELWNSWLDDCSNIGFTAEQFVGAIHNDLQKNGKGSLKTITTTIGIYYDKSHTHKMIWYFHI